MADTFIPVRLSYTGSAVTAIAEYQSGETMQHPGSIQLVGNGRVFSADFSAGAGSLANRARLQSSTLNGQTQVAIVPNGSSTIAGIQCFSNAADLENSPRAGIGIDGTTVTLTADRTGSGSYLPLAVYAGGSQRMLFETGGAVRINNTANPVSSTANTGMYVTGGGYAQVRAATTVFDLFTNTSGPVVGFSNGTTNVGTISVTGSATAYNTSSDHRLKADPQDLDPAAAEGRIMDYRPKTWTWISTGLPGKGFIAHEAQAVDPQVVTGEKDAVKRIGNVRAESYDLIAEGVEEPADLTVYGEGAVWAFVEEVPVYQGMDHSFMIPDMIAMLQKMRRELDEAQSTIRALQGA